MNILVTGYSGFLGRHLIPALSGHNILKINTLNCDLQDQKSVKNFFKSVKELDIIFHLAASTKAGDYCLFHQGDQWISNQLINTNILYQWKIFYPTAKIVAFGTSCGYGTKTDVKIETEYLDGIPEQSLITYAMTKRMLLYGLMAMNQQNHLMKWVYFIPATLYGPRFDEKDSHFIFDIIKKIYNGRKNNKEVELWGDGNQIRQLIYIDDALKIIIKGIKYNNEIFNVCPSTYCSIKQCTEIVCELMDFDYKKIKFNFNKYVGEFKRIICNDKILKFGLINETEFTPIQDGIKKTVNYYLLNKEKFLENG